MTVQNASTDLTSIAIQTMLERGLLPDYPPEAKAQSEQLAPLPLSVTSAVRDMRDRLWFSLDNDESKDLDQLTYAEKKGNDAFTIYIAIADVDSLVKKETPIDLYAQHNTVSVYTPTKIFSMLPIKLSTNLTSLNLNEDRLANIIEIEVHTGGTLGDHHLYPAIVRNQAKLAYPSVAAWLDKTGPIPPPIPAVKGMEDQVRLQDQIAHLLRAYRHQQGSLVLETIESRPILKDGKIVDLQPERDNRAKNLIEEFMIAANTATSQFLSQSQCPVLHRVVRIPKDWDRIVLVAQEKGARLPAQPDANALNAFLLQQKKLDPLRFPDLSLTIIKLLGRGEYLVDYPDQPSLGHFGLALHNYTHSTAPNRRFPDLLTQRLLKAVWQKECCPYTKQQLEQLAAHCTQKEDDAQKVERKMKKCAMIVVLSSQLNHEFEAIVTGASDKGTWIRTFQPPVEGKLVKGFERLNVGDRLKARLVHLDLANGFIDFVKA